MAKCANEIQLQMQILPSCHIKYYVARGTDSHWRIMSSWSLFNPSWFVLGAWRICTWNRFGSGSICVFIVPPGTTHERAANDQRDAFKCRDKILSSIMRHHCNNIKYHPHFILSVLWIQERLFKILKSDSSAFLCDPTVLNLILSLIKVTGVLRILSPKEFLKWMHPFLAERWISGIFCRTFGLTLSMEAFWLLARFCRWKNVEKKLQVYKDLIGPQRRELFAIEIQRVSSKFYGFKISSQN